MRLYFFCLFASVSALSACGGGGGGGSSAGTGVSAGDSLTSTTTVVTTSNTPNSTSSYDSTQYISSISASGVSTIYQTRSNGSFVKYELDADLQEQTYGIADPTSGQITTTCVNSPKINSPGATLSVGKTWNFSYTRTCTGAQPSVTQFNNVGSVVASEAFPTSVGSFDSYKLSYTLTQNITSGSNPGVWVGTNTCWRSKTLNKTVGCNADATFTPSGSSTPTITQTVTTSLTAINVASYTGSQRTIKALSGNWTTQWSGSNAGSCSMLVTDAGTASGSCTQTSPYYESFTVTGTVNANGSINASGSTGAIITGTLNTPISASGTWSNTGTSGSWTGFHN